MVQYLLIKVQVGSLPDHSPLAPQMRVLLPIKEKPSSQEYVATSSTLLPGNITAPFSGGNSGGHAGTVGVNNCDILTHVLYFTL